MLTIQTNKGPVEIKENTTVEYFDGDIQDNRIKFAYQLKHLESFKIKGIWYKVETISEKPGKASKIKFNLHNVVNLETGEKCRVHYSLDNRIDNRKCVTLYAKDYQDDLFSVFPDNAKNDSDSITDYYEKDRINIFEENPHYKAARLTAEKWLVKRGY